MGVASAEILTPSAAGQGGRICAWGLPSMLVPPATAAIMTWDPTSLHVQNKNNSPVPDSNLGSFSSSLLSHPLCHEPLTYPFLFLPLSGTKHPLLNCLLIKQVLNKYIPRERGLGNKAPSQVIITQRSQQLSKSGNKEGVGRTDILPVTSLGRD